MEESERSKLETSDHVLCMIKKDTLIAAEKY